jgi:hypothetical protein
MPVSHMLALVRRVELAARRSPGAQEATQIQVVALEIAAIVLTPTPPGLGHKLYPLL